MANKPINMATGGLMSLPPYIKALDEEDKGVTAYDVDTPESARKGMPSRLLSKQRTRFKKGEDVKKVIPLPILPMDPDDLPPLEEHELEKGDIAWLSNKDKKELIRLNIKKENQDTYGKLTGKEKIRIKELKAKDKEQIKQHVQAPKIKSALGGYMDEFQIAEEEPLSRQKRAIGGRAALEEKYDRRRNYRAFQEGDLVEEEIVEEPLMAPVGMEEPLIGDEIAADDLAMEEDVAMEDAESVLDTSMLSEEEEVVVDAAIEMYPELEAILPKMVATEFTVEELVEGPGTGTSDSVPALLSDGEFVFTAKAVKNIGIDKLRKMMAQAEEAYDAGMVNQEANAELALDETIV